MNGQISIWWALGGGQRPDSVVKRLLESSRDKQADALPTYRPRRWDGGDEIWD